MTGMKSTLFAVFLLSVWANTGVDAEDAKKLDPMADAAIRIKGIGKIAPGREESTQARLMATRAAEIDAKRNLAMLFGRIEVRGDNRVKRIVVDGFVRGAHMVGRPVVKDGYVIVTMEIPLSAIANNLAELHTAVSQARQRREQLEKAFEEAEEGLRVMREKLNQLKTAVAQMEKRLEELEK